MHRNDNRIIKLKIASKVQQIACADFLARYFFDASQRICPGIRGTGFSGVITIDQPGQAILERNSVVITDRISGHFAWFRRLELAFALNRLRNFDVIQKALFPDRL